MVKVNKKKLLAATAWCGGTRRVIGHRRCGWGRGGPWAPPARFVGRGAARSWVPGGDDRNAAALDGLVQAWGKEARVAVVHIGYPRCGHPASLWMT